MNHARDLVQEGRFAPMSRFMMGTVLTHLLLTSLLPTSSFAEVPRLIRYQGQLEDAQGVPLEGPYTLTFRLYDAETAGTKVWEEAQANVPIEAGAFSVLLGQVTPLDVDWTQPRWVSIQVGEDAELAPRQRITSVPLALVAERLAGPVQVATNGHVGIGTTNPEAALDVKGAVLMNDVLKISAFGGPPPHARILNQNGGNLILDAGGGGKILSFSPGWTAGDISVQGWDFPFLHFRSSGNGHMAEIGAQNSETYVKSIYPGGYVTFHAGESERMRVANNGNVGIGTTTPVAKLHVNVETAAPPGGLGSEALGVYSDATSRMTISRASTDGDGAFFQFFKSRGTHASRSAVAVNDLLGAITFRGAENSTTFGTGALITAEVDAPVEAGGSMAGRLSFHTAQGNTSVTTERMRIDKIGRVGIGTTNPGYKLHVEGSAYATGGWYGSSAALKQHVQPLAEHDYAGLLGQLDALDIVRFQWKDGLGMDGQTHLGIIAEQAPELITNQERTAVSASDYLAFLAAGVKALKAEHDALKARVERLEAVLHE